MDRGFEPLGPGHSAAVPSEPKAIGTTARASVASLILRLAQIGVFSALIALGTILSNTLLGFALPPPLFEITVAPAFYLAIAVLYPRQVSFWSTAIGSGVGEVVNIFVFGVAPAAFALTFIPGIIIARAPSTLIVYRFRQKSVQIVALSMALATVYETLAFFFIDWPIYSYTLFYCTGSPCTAPGLLGGFALAAFDFGTLVDLVWVPVAIALVAAVRRAFGLRFFG